MTSNASLSYLKSAIGFNRKIKKKKKTSEKKEQFQACQTHLKITGKRVDQIDIFEVF